MLFVTCILCWYECRDIQPVYYDLLMSTCADLENDNEGSMKRANKVSIWHLFSPSDVDIL